MRPFAQLTPDEQTRAVQYQLDNLTVDPSLLTDATLAPALTALKKLAAQRAHAAYYADPADQIVTLPPPTIPGP